MLNPNFVARAAAAAGLSLGSAALAQTDSFHLMQIEQVIGGLGGDPTKQAIQLRMRSSFQNLVSEARLVAYDAAGLNPVILTDFPANVTQSQSGSRVLIVSPGFPMPAGVTPDTTMTAIIPASYLLAGRITFEDDAGPILWSIAFGGANYTGPNTGDITNDPDGDFGPPFPGPLPLVTNRAVRFQGSVSAPSTTNAQDYAITTGAATLTNNAGQFGALGAQCYADCTKDGALTLADFGCHQTRFVLGNPGADCNADGALSLADFGCFQTAFVVGCP